MVKTCRNHCPFCLYSKHVDHQPGDRSNACQGAMKAIGYLKEGKKGLVLLFKCKSCGVETRNKSAPDDDYEKILLLNQS